MGLIAKNTVIAQTIFDSIVISYEKTGDGMICRYTLLPEGLPMYEFNDGPVMSVECQEHIMVPLLKRSGVGCAYTETRHINYLLEHEFLTNDTSKYSYFEDLYNLCLSVHKMKGDVWINKSNMRDSIAEGYAVCHIYYYEKCVDNHQTTTVYIIEHFSQDVFRMEYTRLLATLNKINNIPMWYSINNSVKPISITVN